MRCQDSIKTQLGRRKTGAGPRRVDLEHRKESGEGSKMPWNIALETTAKGRRTNVGSFCEKTDSTVVMLASGGSLSKTDLYVYLPASPRIGKEVEWTIVYACVCLCVCEQVCIQCVHIHIARSLITLSKDMSL